MGKNVSTMRAHTAPKGLTPQFTEGFRPFWNCNYEHAKTPILQTLVCRWNWTPKRHIYKNHHFPKQIASFSRFRLVISTKIQNVALRLINGFSCEKLRQPQTPRNPRPGMRRMKCNTTHPWTGGAGGLPSTSYLTKNAKSYSFSKHFWPVGKTAEFYF